MIEVSFSRISQILLDLDFAQNAFAACGNDNMSKRLLNDFEYLTSLLTEVKNDSYRIEK